MKIIIKLLCTFLLTGLFFSSCKKNVSKISFEDGTAPILSASNATISLSFVNAANNAVTLSWTNPNYQFSTGTNSHDVAYLVEIDTAGSNFTNPSRKAIGLSKDLSISFLQSELNEYLLNQLNLVPEIAHNIEMRVTASINNALALPSNVLKYTITPYKIPPKVAPPVSGQLFLVGGATPGGWDNPVPTPSQQFTQVSPTMYVLNSIALIPANSYLLLPVNGSWDLKYGANGDNNTNNTIEDDFKSGGGDMLAPTIAGNYKIEVDFQRGRFKLTKL